MQIFSEKCNVALIVFLFLFIVSCTRNVTETQFITENTKFNLIIAGDSTDFKDRIRKKIITRYRKHGNIDVVNLNKLKNIRPEDYDVILIMDTCIAWGDFNWSMKRFLKKLKERDRVVLFMTAANPNWEYTYRDVDAITSASRIENEETIFAELSVEIDKVIFAK